VDWLCFLYATGLEFGDRVKKEDDYINVWYKDCILKAAPMILTLRTRTHL